MRPTNLFTALGILTLGGTAGAAPPLPPPAAVDSSAAPAVGAPAPDFTAVAVGADGKSMPVNLGALRERVVVLAFYPKDRSTGCTAELSKFRDEFAAIFGDGVTVLPVSLDDAATHALWAADMRFPFSLVVDSAGAIAARYGSIDAGKPYANRTVFVIGRDGRVAWRQMRFNTLDEQAYHELAAAVAAAKQR
jgi:peroxiredoxin Q/BCP